MTRTDNQYLTLLDNILRNGIVQENRTGISAKFLPSGTIVSSLEDGFPLLISKKMPVKSCFGEVLGFLRGYDNASDFRKLGCNIWDQNANENDQWLRSPFRKGVDDLGCVYGSTWRDREVFVSCETVSQTELYQADGYVVESMSAGRIVLSKHVDQLAEVVRKIINTPTDRRIIMHAWFPELFPKMALPPCHVLYEFVPDVKNKVLHMTMMQRSCDFLLGVPYNHGGGAFLLALIANATGYAAGTYSHQMTNVHLYENQYIAANEQLSRVILLNMTDIKQPTLEFHTRPNDINPTTALAWLTSVGHDDYTLNNYVNLGPIAKVKMAV